MGSVKLQSGDDLTHVCAMAKPFEDTNCRLCGSNYEEETNNNNQVVVDSDSETTQGSCSSWEDTWIQGTPGTPSYIAKDANSLTFQWEAAKGRDVAAVLYHVEMQEVDVLPGSITPNPHAAPQLVDEELWEVVYSGKECWTQIKSLRPGGYYAARIRACFSEDQYSEYSKVVVFHTTLTVPSEPAPPELMQLGGEMLELKWLAPWEHGGAEITGYRLQICPPPGPLATPCVQNPLCTLRWDWAVVQVFEDVYAGPELSVKVDGLCPFVKYAVRVKAVNEVGESPWSLISCFKTKSSLPQVPHHLSATATSPVPPLSHSAQLRPLFVQFCVELVWCSDRQNGRCRDLFEIEVENREQKFCQYECVGDATQVDIEGLDSGQEYQFRVRGENEVGKSDWSSPMSLRLASTAPSPPSSPFLTATGDQGMHFAWYPPQLLGGRSTIKYEVEVVSIEPTILEGALSMWKVVYQGSDQECVVSGLNAGSAYCMRVKAMNEAGWGPPSLPLHFETPPGVPEAPLVPHAVERYERTLRIYWIAPAHDGGKRIEQYLMQICPATQLIAIDNTEPFVDVYKGPRNATTVSDLLPGTVYAIRVCAINEIGQSTWSDIGYESTPGGPPLPPQSLQFSQSDGAHHLCWEAPESDGGALVNDYIVALAQTLPQGSSRPDFQQVYRGTALHCFLTCLEPSSSYLVKARAINSHGESAWSSILAFETRFNVPLDAPKQLEALKITTHELQLGWRPLSHETTLYSLEICSNEEDWSESYRGEARICSIAGLTAGKAYRVRVRAVHGDELGPCSDALSVVMDAYPPATPSIPVLTQVTHTTLRLKWSSPEDHGSRILQYRIEVQGTDGALYEIEVPASKLFHRIEELTPQTDYTLRLAAVNERGSSAWSEPLSALTRSAPPRTPYDLSTVVEDTGIAVCWQMAEMSEGVSFEIEACLSGSKKTKNQGVTLKSSSSVLCCTLQGCEPGQKYDIRVRAICNTVLSKWSEPVSVRVPDEPMPQIKTAPQPEPLLTDEVEGINPRRVRRGQVLVTAKTKNPLKRRKSAWKMLKSNSLVMILVIVALALFLMLFLNQ